MRIHASIVALLACSFVGAAQAEGGLATDSDQVPWLRFQGRVALSGAPAWRSDLAPAANSGNGVKLGGAAVMGDVYFGSSDASRAGGFRATSGLLLGSRPTLWGAPAAASARSTISVDHRLAALPGEAEAGGTLPYFGVGYSRLAAHGGWSFSADLGVMSLAPSNAVRLGRVVGGSQNLDDVVRDMRLAPVLQLGASYSF